MSTYKTHIEWGPFGECATEIEYEYTENADPETAGEAEITGARFYDCSQGMWIDVSLETALNCKDADEIREWHEEINPADVLFESADHHRAWLLGVD